MNAVKVDIKALYKCSSCNTHYLDEKTAEICCPKCKCGMPVKKGRTMCVDCLSTEENSEAFARFLRAEIVKESDLEEPYMLHDGSDYYQSSEDYADQHEDDVWDDDVGTCWLYVCRKVVPSLSASDIECNITDRMYEDAELPAKAREILEDACNKINQIIIDENFCSFDMAYKYRVEVKL